MKYVLTFMILIGFSGFAFADELSPVPSQFRDTAGLPIDLSPLYAEKEISPIPLAPLKQMTSGLSPEDIQCKSGFYLLVKHDGSPSCVQPQTAVKLTENTTGRAGWDPSQQLWEKLENQAYSIFPDSSCPRYCTTMEPVDIMEKANENTNLRVDLHSHIPEGYDNFRFFARENYLGIQVSPEPLTENTTWSEFYFLHHGLFLEFVDSPATVDGRAQAAYWAKNSNAQNIKIQDEPVYVKERGLTYDENLRLLFLGHPSEAQFNMDDDIHVTVAGYMPQEEIISIANSLLQNEAKNCSHNQTYDEVLFKCVVSCEDDLVYNGYTDSCSTEFELKYHGFCNDGFTYNPSSHVCYSDESQHIPLKDPPRSPPPEPEPTYTLTEVHCFPNQVIYNDECIYVLTPSDEFPKDMTKYFSMVDDKIINFCEIKNPTLQGSENTSGVTIDRCFEMSHYKISDVNVIKFQSTTPPTWINIRMENLTRNVELGSSPTFRVVESGWGNGCTSPTLEVYHMKQEFGTEPSIDDLIYKHRIVYSCPYYEPTYPPRDVLRIWDESDFPEFPICETQGKYLIIGDSGYERLALYYYYCGIENED